MMKLNSLLLCVALTLTAANLTAQAGPQTVDLGNTAHFAVLSYAGVTNTGNSVITGDIGVAPGTSVTGFIPITSGGPGKVIGTIYTPTKVCTAKNCITRTNDIAALGESSLLVAYNDAAARPAGPSEIGDIGGLTLTPGVYTSTSGMEISGTLTLSGKGVYIFQMASGLTVDSNSKVVLAGGAQAANVFWQVGSSAALGTYSEFEGTILADTSVTIATGASVNGRALALNGDVTLEDNAVTIPAVKGTKPSPPPPPPPPPPHTHK
jgi:hypothetical protein